jgi:hypothetical protein
MWARVAAESTRRPTSVSDSSIETEERITPGHTKGGDPPYIFTKLPQALRISVDTSKTT